MRVELNVSVKEVSERINGKSGAASQSMLAARDGKRFFPTMDLEQIVGSRAVTHHSCLDEPFWRLPIMSAIKAIFVIEYSKRTSRVCASRMVKCNSVKHSRCMSWCIWSSGKLFQSSQSGPFRHHGNILTWDYGISQFFIWHVLLLLGNAILTWVFIHWTMTSNTDLAGHYFTGTGL